MEKEWKWVQINHVILPYKNIKIRIGVNIPNNVHFDFFSIIFQI
jgi:hypothetical protein